MSFEYHKLDCFFDFLFFFFKGQHTFVSPVWVDQELSTTLPGIFDSNFDKGSVEVLIGTGCHLQPGLGKDFQDHVFEQTVP